MTGDEERENTQSYIYSIQWIFLCKTPNIREYSILNKVFVYVTHKDNTVRKWKTKVLDTTSNARYQRFRCLSTGKVLVVGLSN